METCDALVAATMPTDLKPGHSFSSRVNAWMERGFSKLFFVIKSMRGDEHAAAGVGVRLGITDYLALAAVAALIQYERVHDCRTDPRRERSGGPVSRRHTVLCTT